MSQSGLVNPTSKAEYIVDNSTGCWLWNKAMSDNGYGVAWDREIRKLMPAHRYMFKKMRGFLPNSDLDHLCRNRRCVNPEHLEPATRATNSRRGMATKLTEAQVSVIKYLNTTGIGYRRLARMFGVHRATIGSIIKERNWKGVHAAIA